VAQYEMNLRDYWRIVRRRRLVIVASTLMVAFLSYWFTQQRVPVYQATSSVRYQQSASLAGLLVEVLSYSSGDTIDSQATIIRSFPVMEDVARRLGRLPAGAGSAPARESKTYAAAIDSLIGQVKTARVGDTNIIEIMATSSNPREARDLANTVAEAYRDYSTKLRNARVTEARQFIEAQLRDVEARVKRNEEEMWAFREANRIISPGAESTVLLSLFTQLRSDIERARQQRTELELAQGRLARGDLTTGDRVFVEATNPAVSRLQASLVELTLERNNLALELTEKHPRLKVIDDRIREVQLELQREVAAQIAQLRSREEILNRQIGELFQKNKEVPTVELALQRLQREARVNDDLLTLLKTKHQEALIKEAERVEEVTIMRPASEPGEAASGETAHVLVAGALIGLILGMVLAFVQETLDTSIGTIEDVESYLEVPVLGVIPHIDPRETVDRLLERRPGLAQMDRESLQRHALLVTHFDPKSPVAEAYRTLRSNIQFARMDRPGKVFVVTSPTLQEGKTTTIVNLALTMAQSGQKTLLLGANLRRPSIFRFFGIEREPGLSEILVGSARWQDCLRTVADLLMGRFEMEDVMAAPGLDNLNIIESGAVPANPSEILSTPALADFFRQVRQHYDIVLIDTPPVLPVTDSAIVAAQVDGVILVYQAGKVGRLVLKRAKIHLESARAQVWGVVLNDIQPEVSGSASYTHYYTHYYGEEGAGSPAPAKGWTERLRSLLPSRVSAGRSRPPEPSRLAASADLGAAAGPADEPAAPAGSRPIRIVAITLVTLALAAAAGLGWWTGWVAPPPSLQNLLQGWLTSREAPAALLVQRKPLARPPAPAPVASSGVMPAPAPPAPVTLAPPPRPATPAPPAATAAAPSEPAPALSATFALEFGPFLTEVDADRVERQLNLRGLQTARFRQRAAGASVYGVFIDNVPTRADAEKLAAELRAREFPEPLVVGSAEPYAVRVGPPAALRIAVQMAERLKENGHIVRVSAQPGDAVTFTIRHGHFEDRAEAEQRRRDLAAQGASGQVVRVK
jgi:Mrp family chromosome partitioning ATPase/uncharacterized protein involved in exopolysaccharide biosynthesis/cell division protein FtsN